MNVNTENFALIKKSTDIQGSYKTGCKADLFESRRFRSNEQLVASLTYSRAIIKKLQMYAK